MKKRFGYIAIILFLIGFISYFYLADANISVNKPSTLNVHDYKVKVPTKAEYDAFFDVDVIENTDREELNYFANSTYTFRTYSTQQNVYLEHLPYTLTLYVLSKEDAVQKEIKANNYLSYVQKSIEQGELIEKNEYYSIFKLENTMGEMYTTYNGIIYEDKNIVMTYIINGYYLDENLTDQKVEEKIRMFIDSLYHLVIKDGKESSYHKDIVDYNTKYQEAISSDLQISFDRKVGNALLIQIENPTDISYESIKIQGNFDGVYRNYNIDHIPQKETITIGLEGPIISKDGMSSYTAYQNASFYVIDEKISNNKIISHKKDVQVTVTKKPINNEVGVIRNYSDKVLYYEGYCIINDTLITTYAGAEDDHQRPMLSISIKELNPNRFVANQFKTKESEYWYLDSNYWCTGKIDQEAEIEFILGKACEIVE